MRAQISECLFLVSSFSIFYCLVRFCIEMLVVSSEDCTKSEATGAYLALQKGKMLAGRSSEDRDTRESRDLKYNIFPAGRNYGHAFPPLETIPSLVLLSPFCQSRECLKLHLRSFHTEFAYQSERRLSDLSFCMLSLLRSSLSYVKKAIRVVSVYFKQNGC